MRNLGADEAIDYRGQRFEHVARDIDLVFDLVDGETQARSWVVLKRGLLLFDTLHIVLVIGPIVVALPLS